MIDRHMITTRITVQPSMSGKWEWLPSVWSRLTIVWGLILVLNLFSTMPDDRPYKYTESPQHGLTSTLSTTSGLGSNFTNTSGMTLPPTPSPRRKLSMASLNETPEMEAGQDPSQFPYLYPAKPFTFRDIVQPDYRHRSYVPDYAPSNRDAAYFGRHY